MEANWAKHIESCRRIWYVCYLCNGNEPGYGNWEFRYLAIVINLGNYEEKKSLENLKKTQNINSHRG